MIPSKLSRTILPIILVTGLSFSACAPKETHSTNEGVVPGEKLDYPLTKHIQLSNNFWFLWHEYKKTDQTSPTSFNYDATLFHWNKDTGFLVDAKNERVKWLSEDVTQAQLANDDQLFSDDETLELSGPYEKLKAEITADCKSDECISKLNRVLALDGDGSVPDPDGLKQKIDDAFTLSNQKKFEKWKKVPSTAGSSQSGQTSLTPDVESLWESLYGAKSEILPIHPKMPELVRVKKKQFDSYYLGRSAVDRITTVTDYFQSGPEIKLSFEPLPACGSIRVILSNWATDPKDTANKVTFSTKNLDWKSPAPVSAQKGTSKSAPADPSAPSTDPECKTSAPGLTQMAQKYTIENASYNPRFGTIHFEARIYEGAKDKKSAQEFRVRTVEKIYRMTFSRVQEERTQRLAPITTETGDLKIYYSGEITLLERDPATGNFVETRWGRGFSTGTLPIN